MIAPGYGNVEKNRFSGASPEMAVRCNLKISVPSAAGNKMDVKGHIFNPSPPAQFAFGFWD